MSSELFHLQAWTPEIVDTADDVIDEIHQRCPELRVLFMGAAALGLPGKNDIDLDILCPADKISTYATTLSEALGKPRQLTDTIAEWHAMRNGFEVDCLLSDPTQSHVPRQTAIFELLRTDAEVRESYHQLKINADGLSMEIYEQRKRDFFRRLEER